MRSKVMKQRVLMFFRDFREYVNGGKARRAAEWDAVTAKAQADADRAARIRANRSAGAKRGWQTRRAKRSEGNGVVGAASSDAAGGKAGSAVEEPAIPTPADPNWNTAGIANPGTWDDHNDALARQRDSDGSDWPPDDFAWQATS